MGNGRVGKITVRAASRRTASCVVIGTEWRFGRLIALIARLPKFG